MPGTFSSSDLDGDLASDSTRKLSSSYWQRVPVSCPIEGPDRSVSGPSYFQFLFVLDPRSTDLRIYISMDLPMSCMRPLLGSSGISSE